MALNVFEPRYRLMIRRCMEGGCSASRAQPCTAWSGSQWSAREQAARQADVGRRRPLPVPTRLRRRPSHSLAGNRRFGMATANRQHQLGEVRVGARVPAAHPPLLLPGPACAQAGRRAGREAPAGDPTARTAARSLPRMPTPPNTHARCRWPARPRSSSASRSPTAGSTLRLSAGAASAWPTPGSRWGGWRSGAQRAACDFYGAGCRLGRWPPSLTGRPCSSCSSPVRSPSHRAGRLPRRPARLLLGRRAGRGQPRGGGAAGGVGRGAGACRCAWPARPHALPLARCCRAGTCWAGWERPC